MNFLERLLDHYHLSFNQYESMIQDVNEGVIPSYNIFNNIAKVKDRILKAIKNKEKILIYGDYDCDGIMATSILVSAFKKLDYPVDYYIPSRYKDGYGINVNQVKIAKEKGYQLIITVDNGVNAFDAIKQAHNLNIEIIITDHHEYNELPDVDYFLHPKESSLKVTTSGAVVAFYLSYALLNRIDNYLLVMAANSVIADVMPLKEENRDLVKLGIKYLNKNKYLPFNLLSFSYSYDEIVLGIKVNPKINAIGRIEKGEEVNILVKYFTSNNYKELINIRNYIEEVNNRRKQLANEALKSLLDDKQSAYVTKLDIISGLSGLIASRILANKNVPTAIFARDEITNNLRGSIRSKNGCSVIEFINNNLDLFIEHGGHDLAAGVVIKEENYEELKSRFIKFADEHPFKKESGYIPILINEINMKNYKLIRSLSPFGQDFKEPTFIINNVEVSNIKRFGKNLEHLSILVSSGVKIIGFNYPFNKITSDKIDLIGKFSLNNYKNITTLNFTLEN